VKHRRAFGDVLTKAVHRIAADEQRTIGAIQDELGYAIGRESGGTAIEHWRKGNVPAHSDEVERLAATLYQRDGLRDRAEVQTFLRYAAHPDVFGCSARLLSDPSTVEPLPDDELPPTSGAPPANVPPARATLVLEGSVDTFHEQERERVIAGVAALLGLNPEHIVIAQVVSGSVRMTLELPVSAAARLHAFKTTDHPTLKALNIMNIAWEPATIAAAAILRLHETTYLEAVNMRINGAAARLWELATEGLARLADPLLPAPQPSDLDDATRQAALQAYLEVRLERDDTLRDQVAALLDQTDPAVVWKQVQRMAVLVRQIAQTVSMQMGHDPAALTPALYDYIRHQTDPWQADLPRRWWRWPWQRWLHASGDQVWHIRIAHALALALVQIDAQVWQDRQALSTVLTEKMRGVLARARVPRHDRPAFLDALLDNQPQVQSLVSIIYAQRQQSQPSPELSTSSESPYHTTRQEGALRLAVSTGPQRGFLLSVPIPQTPALAVLSGQESLFSDHLPEVAHIPMVSVTLREENQRLTLLVGVSEAAARGRWQVDLLVDDQVFASGRTDESGIARLPDLPRDLVQRQQMTLRCVELLFQEEDQQQEEE
jgi:hypothetical protein